MNNDALLTTTAAAKFLSVSKAFLERDRWAGATIPFIRVGSRAIRYRKNDLNSFIESRAMRAAVAEGASPAGARDLAQVSVS